MDTSLVSSTAGVPVTRGARRPGVTVIVPAYNEADTVGDTILSLQRQTSPATEIIVIDDGSSDDTGEVARRYGVRVVRPPTTPARRPARRIMPCNS